MRFFAEDPLLASFRITDRDLADLNRIVFTHPTSPGLKLLLAPINEIDVNGMHFMQPVNFASQAVLEPIMALQPTDLLQAAPHPSFANATSYADENGWVLQRLEDAHVDIKYVTCCMPPSVCCCVSSDVPRDHFVSTQLPVDIEPAQSRGTGLSRSAGASSRSLRRMESGGESVGRRSQRSIVSRC